MHRRTTLISLASLFLTACGGGEGGGESPLPAGTTPTPAPPSPAPAPSPAPGPTPSPSPAPAPQSANIAMWGDSLTVPVAPNLQLLYPDRAVYNGGVTGETSTQILARHLADGANHAGWIHVFWYGHNNKTDPVRIKADIATSVAALGPGARFIVLSLNNSALANQVVGGSLYETIMQLNRDLAATYPDNYLDVRAWLMSQANQDYPQDAVDVFAGTIPSSLRFDEIHMNNDGSILVALKVREFIEAKHW